MAHLSWKEEHADKVKRLVDTLCYKPLRDWYEEYHENARASYYERELALPPGSWVEEQDPEARRWKEYTMEHKCIVYSFDPTDWETIKVTETIDVTHTVEVGPEKGRMRELKNKIQDYLKSREEESITKILDTL